MQKGDKIVFLGDSITSNGGGPNGYVTLIQNRLKQRQPDWNLEIVNAGIGGNKVPDLQKRLDKDVLERKPTMAVVYIGINDVWHSLAGKGTPKELYEAGLKDIISRIRRVGVGMMLCTPSVIGEKTDGTNPLDKMLDEYAEISRGIAADFNVPVCDLRKAFLDYLKVHNPKNENSGILTLDTCHLNEAGNALVAERIYGLLKKMGLRVLMG